MRVLLTGATGFVGGHLWPALEGEGCEVVGLTRSAEKARARWPERAWAEGDVADETAMERALRGCDAAYYLVHGMGEGAVDFRRREVKAAQCFARAAHTAGVRRIVYLGGMAPEGPPSEHLRSRLEVGEALRNSPVPTVELRSSMIVGHGSLSWLMVRDLAARLPCMILPRWLKSRTQPISVDDVMLALVRSLTLPLKTSDWFDLPGPEALSGVEILQRTADALGRRRPLTVDVPVLSPWLSSHWVHFVTRAEWSVAREIVVGLTHDMLAHDDRFWRECGHTSLLSFADAARRALAAERGEGEIPGFWGGVEGWLSRVARARGPV